jgi:hypothetical protein
MTDAIDILAVLTRPSFPSGTGPIGDHLGLRALAARRPDLRIHAIELNAGTLHVEIDRDALLIEAEGAPTRIAAAGLVLFMPVSFDVEETDLAATPPVAPYPTFAHWQWRAVTEWLEERLPRIGRCVNVPRAARRANNKLLQWEALTAAGFKIPPLVVATRWPSLEPLASAPELIRKNLSESGWKAPGVFSPAQRARRDDPGDGLPAIWQQPVEAATEIRAYVMGEDAIFVELERDAGIVDVRVTHNGRPRARIVEPQTGWAEIALGAARALDLDYAVIDAMPTDSGLAILEVNSNGVWWFLPPDIGAVLEAKFHAWLERLVDGAPSP